MKKLMVTIATAMVGLAVNAATCGWGTETIAEYTVAEGYSIWAFDTATYAIETAIADFQSGSLNFAYGAQGEIDGAEAAGDLGGYDKGGSVNMYVVLFNNEDASLAQYAFFSSVESTTIPSTGLGAFVEFDMTASADANNWTAAVPEPTSGLMMLLGMGVLALRRRRA